MLPYFRGLSLILPLALAVAALSAEAPQSFPTPTVPLPKTAPAVPPAQPATPAPTAAMLGVQLYPSAVFLKSYDAGRGQRFYLFGTEVPYQEMVMYYKTVLKQKGEELYEAPPTYQFEIGKFREDVMAFVPSVTVKDFTYGGSAGFPNPTGGQPVRFPTILQIVPATPGTPKN